MTLLLIAWDIVEKAGVVGLLILIAYIALIVGAVLWLIGTVLRELARATARGIRRVHGRRRLRLSGQLEFSAFGDLQPRARRYVDVDDPQRRRLLQLATRQHTIEAQCGWSKRTRAR